jgi:hypothetical protein
VLGIFIKATGSNETIPGYYGIMPEAPAVIGEFSFEFIAFICFAVTAEFIN